MQIIYVEQAIKNHPTTLRILQTLSEQALVIDCQHYGEIFNRKSQNFRLQKQNPALILAKKTGQLVLPTPKSFGIGGMHNYYFSHMLNCLYDCRYCFLQGMYSSGHYVLFVNYDDFMQSIDQVLQQHATDKNGKAERVYFFSGYDCDSLAYEPITQFVQSFIPFFANRPHAILELRTKSTNIRQIRPFAPISNVVIAYSLSPDAIASQFEHKAPGVEKRLKALQQLVAHGWPIGIRLDPLIYVDDFKQQYQTLIAQIFSHISPQNLHSISIGPLRFPEKMYQRIVKLYPQDPLLAHPLYKRKNYVSYRQEIEIAMKTFISETLANYVDNTLLFECSPL